MSLHRAVLLAAGRGSRLGPLTDDTPKCLLPVGGVPLLSLQLDALAKAGISDVTVVAGFQAERIESHVAGRCRVIRNEAWAATNSVASLHRAAPHVRGHAFVFQNADVLYAPELITRFAGTPHENACLVDPLRPFAAGEYHVEVDHGRITRYSKEVPPGRSVGRSAQLMRIGAVDSVPFLDRIAELANGDGVQGFPNQAYGLLMAGSGLSPVYTAGLPWWEVDTADDYAHCCTEFGRSPEAVEAARPLPGRVTRALNLVRHRRLPWRLSWLPMTMHGVAAHPMRTASQVRAFRNGALSRDGLDLAVNGLRFLRLLLEEAKAANLELQLLWGTLLGCVRDGGLIRGDHDLDLGVMADDAGRLPVLRKRMLARGFRVRIEAPDKLSLVHPRHPGLFLDLDVVRPHPRGWVISNVYSDPPRRFHYIFPPAVFASVQQARFAGALDVRIPGDAEGFLGAVYGNWREPRAKVHYLYGPDNVEVELAR